MRVWVAIDVNESWRADMAGWQMEWLGFLAGRMQRGIGPRGTVVDLLEEYIDDETGEEKVTVANADVCSDERQRL
ncbi:MAG: hypothetical protein ACOC6S_01450 [Chloroflexota bacterium]